MTVDIINRPPNHEAPTFQREVRNLELIDLDGIKPILENWVKDRDINTPLPGEVEEDLTLMRENI